MMTNGSGRSAMIGVAGLVGLCATSVACAEISLLMDGVEYVGNEFSLVSTDMLTGMIDSGDGDFWLDAEGENFTWCDDLTVLVANSDLSDIHIQLGGYSDLGATNRFGWPTGASGTAGTFGGGHVEMGGIDVSGYYLYLGNGYLGGGLGIWSGAIDLNGSIAYVPAPGAIALLGLGGLVARRRRH